MKVILVKDLKRKGRVTLKKGRKPSFTSEYANELIGKGIAVEYKGPYTKVDEVVEHKGE